MAAELSLDDVLSAFERLYKECTKSRRALTAVEVAKELGLKRLALYSRFPEATDALAASLRKFDEVGGQFGRPRDERVKEAEDRLRVVRRDRDEFTIEPAVYAEQI